MKNERKQLEIIERQLQKALDIVEQQKRRYESLMSDQLHYTWTMENEDCSDNEICLGILSAMGSLGGAIENIYNY